MNHLAVVRRAYLDLILSGEKTIESRLTKVRCAPFGRIERGDGVFFKEPSGPVRARARVARVRIHENLTPGGVRDLRRRHNGRIHGERDYWSAKRDARYAVLIWLDHVEPAADWSVKPRLHGRGWLCLTPGDAPPGAHGWWSACAT